MNTHHTFADSPFETINPETTAQVTGGFGQWLGLASQIVGLVGQNVKNPRAQGILGAVSQGLGAFAGGGQ